ncbi:ABC transporter ATP-binding protein [Paludicola sp. MB14-C6]|uniref:ABC transporter ATP-binding protein n=1 Tax=Paludihabitans sp. MB14-C6 TaxID=3070656 RepID=UPI0027DDF317|nr:ABC transporter ATP-binding protein [Paludicola sp. MB14-C6]WMJ21809.1 ABC transporter ATP-binding protein [Paludicola sp. MB14-C6]
MFQIRWIWQNMKGFRVRYIFALFSTVILAASCMGNSLIIGQIMDNVFTPISKGTAVTQELINTLIFWVVFLIVFTLCRTSFCYLSVMTYESCSQKLIYKLRGHLYKNMQCQDMHFYSQNRTGDLMTRLTGDMDMIRHTVAWVFRMIIDSIVLFTSTAICFIVLDPLLAGCVLIFTPVILIFTVKFGKKVGPLYVDLRERLSQLNTCAQENISGNRVVKAFAQEEQEINKFDKKNEDFKKANLKATMLWLKYCPYIDGFSQALSIAVLLVGGYFLIIGRISIGTFTVFNGLCWTLTNPMRMIGMLVNDLQRFFASASKIIELYYSRSTIASRHDAKNKEERIEGNITFKNVCFNMHNAEVLKNINLEIKKGETVAIMGSTGSGKTSLVNLIPRFMDIKKGELLIDEIPVNRWDLHKLRSSIGIATQDVFLFSDTVDGNIAYGDTKLSEEEVAKFAKAACVDFIEKLPQGFDTVIGERGTGLSGGQKQRIALARALAVKPSILILDDTTSAVDLETEKYIQNELNHLDFSCTKIIVAQRISTTKKADKVIVLDKGEIIQVGTHKELINQDGYYKEVYMLQNGQENSLGGVIHG